MTAELGNFRVATERAHLPPMTFVDMFHWDGVRTMSWDRGPMTSSKHSLPHIHSARVLPQTSAEAQGHIDTGWQARPSLARNDPCSVPSTAPHAIDWAREAACLTVSLDQGLLLAPARGAIPGATGELVWVYREGQASCITLYVHPVLLVHSASDLLHANRVKIVPHLHASDPLLHHMTLVLQATIEAEEVPGRMYAEVLTNALAVHLLRCYETCRPPAGASLGRLSKPKLRRTIAHINAHLAQELSLTELAAVAQTSPAHFARLFKQETGRTPLQYVTMCRIERAKQLLTETEMPIIDIGRQVGFTDQSYFTAVFRKYIAMTPKAHRDGTQR
jgi:AraC-like DNA-binding protein